MYRYSRPLLDNKDPEAIKARALLEIDGIQAQGLLRNCNSSHFNRNLINVLETYFKLSRNMDIEAYNKLLMNSVYSKDKAIKIRGQIEYLGQ